MTDLFANESLRASAGTGKTFQLTNRYMRLLLGGETLDSILASTFTRKAAGEIKTRVLTRLADAMLDDDKLEELAEHTGNSDVKRETIGELLKTLTSCLHRMQITTLDGFFAQLVRAFALELGLSPSWSTLSDVQLSELKSETIAQMLDGYQTDTASDMFRMLTRGDAGRSVSDLIINAVSSIYHVFLDSSDSIWDIPYAIEPMAEEERSSLLNDLSAVELPSDKRIVKKVNDDIALVTDEDWRGFGKSGLLGKIVKGEEKYYGKEIPPVLDSIYRRFHEQVQFTLIRELTGINDATHTLVRDYADIFSTLKQNANGLSFADVTRILSEVTRQQTGESIAFRCDSNIKHLLLDEFQDTSLDQWRALEPIAARSAADNSATLFCVGDTKQAIYGWRGGRREIFDILERQFDIEPDPSDFSQRSSPIVLNAVNRIFTNFTDNPLIADNREVYENWCSDFTAHQAADRVAGLPGYAELRQCAVSENIGDALQQTISSAISIATELLQENPTLSIGVILRKNDSVATAINAFRQHGLDATQGGGVPAIGHAIVQLFGSLLLLTDHPDNTVAAFHVASSPLATHIGLTDWSDHGSRHEVARRLRSDFQRHGYAKPLESLVHAIAQHLDHVDYAAAEQLIEQTHLCERTTPTRTRDLLAHLTGTRVEFKTSSNIHILNIHQAKGLEYDAVILPELHILLNSRPPKYVYSRSGTEITQVMRYCNKDEFGLLPDELKEIQNAHTEERITELMCMLYVALTRAKHGLYLVVPPITNTEKPPGRYHELIHHALCGKYLTPDIEVPWYDGDSRWPSELDRTPDPVAEVIQLPKNLKVDIAKREISKFNSASQLEGGELQDVSTLFEPLNTGGMAYGDLVHELYEQVNWLDETPTLDPNLIRTDLSQDVLGTAVVKVQSQLDSESNSPFFRSFYTAEYLSLNPSIGRACTTVSEMSLQVKHESAILMRNNDTISTGYIDRLVLVFVNNKVVAADIVDYKTDTIRDDDHLANRVEHYSPQLTRYMDAIQQMYRLPENHVTSRLVFVNSHQIVEIPNRRD